MEVNDEGSLFTVTPNYVFSMFHLVECEMWRGFNEISLEGSTGKWCLCAVKYCTFCISILHTWCIRVNTVHATYISPGEKISACHTSLPWHTHVFFSQVKAFPIKDQSFTLDPWIAVFQEGHCFLTKDWKRCCHCCRLQSRIGISNLLSINPESKKKKNHWKPIMSKT